MADTGPGLVLPSFSKPPVVEVAMAFGFAPIDGVQFDVMADLRTRWLEEYPSAQEQPYLEPVPGHQQQTIRLEFGPPPRRIWLIGSGGNRLVQIQKDRFIANWREVTGSGESYPHYDVLRVEFAERWNDFSTFLTERLNGIKVVPEYAEVTYVNTVAPRNPESLTIHDVLLSTKRVSLEEAGLAVGNYQEAWSSADGRERLTIAANVDTTAPDAPILLHLSAIVRTDATRESFAALDRAHELVVGTFGVVTTKAMQERWGRNT